MKATSRHGLSRLFLNAFFTGFIFWAALTNNTGTRIAIGHVLLFNLLLFVPGWINVFSLLPKLRRDKKAGHYLLSLLLIFLSATLF